MENLIQLKIADIRKYRAKLLKEQGNVCAICKLVCKKYVLDHQHKRRKSDPNGPNGDGLVRGTLCDGCNRIEGKVWNNSIRFGKHNMLPTLLRNMADYLEQDNYPWIHPSERPVAPKIYKRKYNELKHKMNEEENIDPPPFTKRKKKMSTRLLSCFKKYDIDPYTPSTTKKATKLNQDEESHQEPDVGVSCPGIEPDIDSTD